MTEQVLTNKLILLDDLNLSGNLNECRLALGNDLKEVTTFEDSFRTRVGGLEDVAFSAAGFFDAADPDDSLFTARGVNDSLITLADSTTLGSVAYFLRSILGQYTPIEGGQVGEPHKFMLEAGCYAGELYRGTLMEHGQQTVSANGTGRQLGAVSATQSIYLSLHVRAVSGDWDVIVESDDNSGFTTATTRITVAGITAVGGNFDSLSGAITDDYWRLRFVENSAGSITVSAVLSIQ